MESVYDLARKRQENSAIVRFILSDCGWSTKESKVFEDCKKALEERVTLCHRDEKKRLLFFTDASDTFWYGIVTQVLMDDVSLT